jgi:protein required for attachment to host cells
MARCKTWGLVMNGVRARILRHLENGNSEDPTEIVSKTKSTHLREFLSDKAESGPESDLIRADMHEFAQETLSVLEDHFRKGHLTRLVIFATPQMLPILRREMPAPLKSAVILERDFCLTNLPETELRQTVVRALREELDN